jgi:hypothetical protein
VLGAIPTYIGACHEVQNDPNSGDDFCMRNNTCERIWEQPT